MKKELSKKISLMLCGALFLPNLVGLSSVNANPTKLMGSSDTKRAVGVRRPRPSDSQETAGGEEATGMSTPRRDAGGRMECPDTPKKSGLVSMFDLLTLEEQQEAQSSFNNIGRLDTPTEGESVTAAVNFPVPEEQRRFRDAFEVHPQRFSDSFMRFNERFVNLFVGLCQRFQINEAVYNRTSGAGDVLDIIYSNRYLFQDGSFIVLMRYIRNFLTWDGSPTFIHLMDMCLDNFATENGLNS